MKLQYILIHYFVPSEVRLHVFIHSGGTLVGLDLDTGLHVLHYF